MVDAGTHCGWEYGLGLAHGNFSQVYIVLKEEQSMRVVKGSTPSSGPGHALVSLPCQTGERTKNKNI